MKGDTLASGGATATFPAGKSSVDDPVILNYALSDANEVPDSDESWQASQSLLDAGAHQQIIANLKPLNDRVLLRRFEEKDNRKVQTAEAFKMKSNRGIVLAVGSGMVLGNELLPIPLTQGDKVLFGEYSAEDVTIDGEELVLISAFDIRLKL